MEYQIAADRCVACLACVRVCPAGAVAVAAPSVRIVDDACIRCGECVPACPHDAIAAGGDLERAVELARGGRAALILNVACAAYFFPASPEQVVNACYAAGFPIVPRGVVGDELVAGEYARMWRDEPGGTQIRSTCPVIVRLVCERYPELVPFLAPVTTPVAAEVRYLRALHGADLPVVHAGVCLGDGRDLLDAAITFSELRQLWERCGVELQAQARYFTRIPEERRRHAATAGGLPLAPTPDGQAARPVCRVRGLDGLDAIAEVVARDRIDLGFVDILPCEDCLDHPLMGPREGLFRRRQILAGAEPPRAPDPIVNAAVVARIELGAVFPLQRARQEMATEPLTGEIEAVLEQIGPAPNGRHWDCGACGFATCRGFAAAAVRGRAALQSCPPFLSRQLREAGTQTSRDALTGLATRETLRERLVAEMARSWRSGEPFALLFVDLDNFKYINEQRGREEGDRVLCETAGVVQGLIRTTDVAARYGGDEFVVLLVRTDREGGRLVGEKLRARVGGLGSVTASIGVAAFEPVKRQHEDVLVAADRALYRAKSAGRNRVESGA